MATTNWVLRPWGRFFVVYHTPHIWVKTIILHPWARTSLQKHQHREEHWHVHDYGFGAEIGRNERWLTPEHVTVVGYNEPHRLINLRAHEMSLTEVAYGDPDENDIIRLEDDYGRAD